MTIQAFRPLCLICLTCVVFGSTFAEQKPQHTGTKVEGYATVVTTDAISVFDKKKRLIEIHTDKDYSALVGIGAPVTVWYNPEGKLNRLEDIVYPTRAAAFVPPDLIRENVKRIIILARPQDVEDSEGLVKAITSYLSDNTGWYVAPPELAVEIANRHPGYKSSLDAVHPDAGKLSTQPYIAPERALMSAITRETHTDAVLEIEISKVKADVRAGIASWDDMKEPVASPTARALSPIPGLAKGWVYAVSVDMKLWNPAGKLLWRKRRGFAALAEQAGLSGKYRERPLKTIYDDNVRMQRWLVDTLSQLAPPVHGVVPDSTQATPNPPKP